MALARGWPFLLGFPAARIVSKHIYVRYKLSILSDPLLEENKTDQDFQGGEAGLPWRGRHVNHAPACVFWGIAVQLKLQVL